MEADSFIPLDPVHAVSTDMQNETKRMLTFGDWSRKHQKQPQDLIPAGFFYTGDGDKVQCFSCGGCIAGWNINDDPWYEHARLHPTCQIVIEKKGRIRWDIEARFQDICNQAWIQSVWHRPSFRSAFREWSTYERSHSEHEWIWLQDGNRSSGWRTLTFICVFLPGYFSLPYLWKLNHCWAFFIWCQKEL